MKDFDPHFGGQEAFWGRWAVGDEDPKEARELVMVALPDGRFGWAMQAPMDAENVDWEHAQKIALGRAYNPRWAWKHRSRNSPVVKYVFPTLREFRKSALLKWIREHEWKTS